MEYEATVVRFIEESNSEDDPVRDMAVSCAGEILARKRSPELLRHVVAIARDVNEDPGTRDAAADAIAQAASIDHLAWIRSHKLGAGVSNEIIVEAERRHGIGR
jgi:hypothetical protein